MHRMSHPSAFFTPLRLLAAGLLAAALPVQAQNQIYRCGTEYTNNPTAEQKKTCKALDGGNVTVIQAPKPKSNVAGAKPPAPVPASTDQAKVDPGVQKARDSDARAILESEQRRAEQRLAELQREYNGGQPERRGEEVRNQQRYSERVATLKDSLTRAEADLAGIRRELSRAGGGITANANPASTAPLSR
ncbi:MAG: hypothetical protein WBK26_03035 [Burkholderiaceae bacterium]